MAAIFLPFKYLTFYLFCLLYSTGQHSRRDSAVQKHTGILFFLLLLKGNDFNISSFAVDFM